MPQTEGRDVDVLMQFREAEDALESTIRTLVAERVVRDPLDVVFVLVHESSGVVFRHMVESGGAECGDGYALGVGVRNADDPLSGIPSDQIACMISIGNRHKALGLPLDVLGIVGGGQA
jgi:hypothetical protein